MTLGLALLCVCSYPVKNRAKIGLILISISYRIIANALVHTSNPGAAGDFIPRPLVTTDQIMIINDYVIIELI
jgi:hypothetical protein